MGAEPTLSRRAFLASTAGGLSTLAGCAGGRLPWESEHSYSDAALRRLADTTIPSTEPSFPIDIPSRLFESHRDRTEALLDGVPADPQFPNGAIESEVAEQVERARTSLDEDEPDESPLDRLGSARYARARAAEARASYRAATGDLDASEVTARVEALRRNLADFRGAWNYQGRDPFEALVIHRELEDLIGAAERGTERGAVVPSRPKAAPLRVGEIAGTVERGNAALVDAASLRDQYLESVSAPRSYRSTFVRAAEQLERFSWRWQHRTLEYLREQSDQAIDSPGSPEVYLLHELRATIERFRSGFEEAKTRNRFAEALLQAGTAEAYLRAAHPAIEGIRNGEFPPPDSTKPVEAELERGIRTIERVRHSTPSLLATVFADQAKYKLESGLQRLADSDGNPSQVYRGYAFLVLGGMLADAVPGAVSEMARLLRGVDSG